jgi:hypothetical protein
MAPTGRKGITAMSTTTSKKIVKTDAEFLAERERDIRKKHRRVLPGTIRRETEGHHAGKLTVEMKCQNGSCEATRRVATSDLFQVRCCQECTIARPRSRARPRHRLTWPANAEPHSRPGIVPGRLSVLLNTREANMNVFVYSTCGEDETIYLVFAANRAEADDLARAEVDDDEEAFDDLDCTEYGTPTEPASFVLRA